MANLIPRNENSFWAVWGKHNVWPEIFADKVSAVAKAKERAKNDVGTTIYLLQIVPVGTITIPKVPQTTGVLREENSKAKPMRGLNLPTDIDDGECENET